MERMRFAELSASGSMKIDMQTVVSSRRPGELAGADDIRVAMCIASSEVWTGRASISTISPMRIGRRK